MIASKDRARERDGCRFTVRRTLMFAIALVAAAATSAPVLAQTNPCGQNASQRGAKIGGAGNGVLNNVPDYVESPPGTFSLNALPFSSSSSRPTLVTGVTYTWSQTAGSAGSFSATSGGSTVFTLPNIVKPAGAPANWPGEVIKVKLTIVSTLPGCPGTWEDTVTLNVIDIHNPVVNLPPYAQATALPGTVAEGDAVALSAEGSYDPEGLALGYAWTQVSGTAVTLANADTDTASFLAPNTAFPGGETLVFSLRVFDGAFEDVQEVAVNVTWVNDPPLPALACPLSVAEGEAFTLDGSASSDGDDGIALYEWSGGWSGLDLSGTSGSTVQLIAPALGYQDPGIYDFRLTTYDGASHPFDECQVLVRDVTAPQISVPADIVAEAEGPLGNVVSYPASAFDAVDGSLLDAAYFSCVPASGGTFPLGVAPQKSATTAVTCQARDSAGNSGSRGFNITIGDNTAPEFQVPVDFTVEATGPDGAAAEFSAPTRDIVDGAGQAACVPAAGSTLGLGMHPVSCTATDQRGNASASQGFNITVADSTAPEIQVPAPMTVEATGATGATATFAATWTDAVDGGGDAACTPASGSVFAIATTQVDCAHTDTSGNAGSAAFSVTVQDTTPPSLELPEPFSVEATGANGAVVTYTALQHDLVDGTAAANCTPASGMVFALDGTTVTCNGMDARGNASGPGTFVVTVVDTTPPALSLPGPIQVEATGPSGAAVAYTATAVDLVDGNVAPVCAPASGTTFALGGTQVGCYAIDAHGNASATQEFSVTVVDTTPPRLTVPASFSLEATGPGGAIATYAASAVDTVDGALSPVCLPASGALFALGGTTVTCNVADAHGNAAAPRSFTVTVVDTTKPVFSGLVDVNVVSPGNSQAVVDYASPTATDLVDGPVTVSCLPPPGATFQAGTTTVNCLAADRAGNTATGSFKVNVTYAFNGFLQPIDNGAVNTVKAGSAVPVKFSLGGNQSLQIFAAGSPASVAMSCSATAPVDEVEVTVTAGGSNLQYDPGADQYIYVWKTDKAWLGCRQLRVTLRDGSVRTAVFKFR